MVHIGLESPSQQNHVLFLAYETHQKVQMADQRRNLQKMELAWRLLSFSEINQNNIHVELVFKKQTTVQFHRLDPPYNMTWSGYRPSDDEGLYTNLSLWNSQIH